MSKIWKNVKAGSTSFLCPWDAAGLSPFLPSKPNACLTDPLLLPLPDTSLFMASGTDCMAIFFVWLFCFEMHSVEGVGGEEGNNQS
jgi:hypothetical protein